MSEAPGIHRILVAHTGGGLGDLVVSSPVAEALARHYPGAAITFWADERFAPVLEGNPHVARVWTAPARAPWLDLLGAIRAERYDLAVFPWAIDRQAWLAAASRIPRRVGPARRLAYSFLFTDRVVIRSELGDRESHWADVQLDYARALGWRGAPIAPRIRLTEAERTAARVALAARGVSDAEPLCALHVGKGLPIDKVRWPLDRLTDLGRRLVSGLGLRVVVTGSHREHAHAERVARGIGPGALNVAGTDIRGLCGVLDRCALFVGIDSGPMHVAAALGVPVVGIFALKSDCPPRWRAFEAPAGRDGSPAQPVNGRGAARSAVVGTGSWQCALTCVKERCRDFECLAHIDVEAAVATAARMVRG